MERVPRPTTTIRPRAMPMYRPALEPSASRPPACTLWVPSTVLSLRMVTGGRGLLHSGSGPDQYPSSKQALEKFPSRSYPEKYKS